MQRIKPDPPILDYAPPSRSFDFAWQTFVAALSGIVVVPAFMCLCGHLDAMALTASVPTTALAWWGFARPAARSGRVLAIAVAVLASALLLKNLLDVGWYGHEPLFR